METQHHPQAVRTGLSKLSRLLQIGINGNPRVALSPKIVFNFPDYFKSELMETALAEITAPKLITTFPDYFKSELMETQRKKQKPQNHQRLSRLLQIGINGNSQEAFPCVHLKLSLSRLLQIGINGNPRICLCYVSAVFYFPDYFKSELMETSEASPHFIFCATFPITSNRN